MQTKPWGPFKPLPVCSEHMERCFTCWQGQPGHYASPDTWGWLAGRTWPIFQALFRICKGSSMLPSSEKHYLGEGWKPDCVLTSKPFTQCKYEELYASLCVLVSLTRDLGKMLWESSLCLSRVRVCERGPKQKPTTQFVYLTIFSLWSIVTFECATSGHGNCFNPFPPGHAKPSGEAISFCVFETAFQKTREIKIWSQ